MRKKIIHLGAIALVLSLAACNTTQQATEKQATTAKKQTSMTSRVGNPLLLESTLDYGVPDFGKIKNKDFKPALLRAMQLQSERIDKIANNTEEATFDNVFVALEKSGKEFDEVSNVFYLLAGAHTNDTIKAVQMELAPKVSQHFDNIYLNTKLFEKVKKIYQQRKELGLKGEDLKLVEDYYSNFVHAGADLGDTQKIALKKLNTDIASMQNEFSQTLLKAVNAEKLVITNKEELDGLSEGQLKSLRNAEDTAWEITLLNTTQQPLFSSLKNRETRKKLYELSWNRDNDNAYNTNKLLVELAQKRAEKAQILGYDNYADWNLVNTMVQTPKTVEKFFAGLIPATRAKGAKEAKDIQAMMHKEGVDGELKPWDWSYYAEKVRKAKYDLNEDEIKPYFEINNVLEKGVFFAANKLYGLTFKERKDIPTYHPDVKVYEVFEEDGSPLALFYADYFARPSKRGGAWMSNLVTQSKLFHKQPVIYNVCNYTKPAAGEPALLSYDEVSTMFHEFGHALHGLFANQKYPKLSGTSVARDFVEYPSQANEHWALNSTVLKNYAKHYATGETIPDVLIEKIKKASTFNQGFSLTEVMAAANLDFDWHTLTTEQLAQIKSANDFEKKALTEDNLWDPYIPPRYRSSYFAHIFGGGYAAGYYAYLWTEMLANDTGAWFDQHGGLNREAGQRYRDMVLSQGNTQDYKEMYKAFTGRDADVKYMIKARGLDE